MSSAERVLPIETPAPASLVAGAGHTSPGQPPEPGDKASDAATDLRGEAQERGPSLVLTFTVHGQPAPQGSKRGYVVGGRAVLVESSKRVKPWREAVKHAALDAMTAQQFTATVPLEGPLYVSVVYTLPRPKGHYRTGRNAHLLRDAAPRWPASKPDVEKLTRALFDAMTDAGVWRDDSQVVLELSCKSYPHVHPRSLATAGAHVRISRMGDSL